MSKRKQVTKVYKFQANRYIPTEVKAVGADVVGTAIEQAITKAGTVDKKLLVENARPEDAPLHPCFEWIDETAADLYRQYQARNIVNVVTVEIKGHNVAAFPTVAVRVAEEGDPNTPPQRENIRVQTLLDDPELRQQKVNEVLSKLLRIRQEYQTLNELTIVWRAIDELQTSTK